MLCEVALRSREKEAYSYRKSGSRMARFVSSSPLATRCAVASKASYGGARAPLTRLSEARISTCTILNWDKRRIHHRESYVKKAA